MTKPVSKFNTVNINDSCQLGWQLESNGRQSCLIDTLLHKSCHTITLIIDQLQNHMLCEKYAYKIY